MKVVVVVAAAAAAAAATSLSDNIMIGPYTSEVNIHLHFFLSVSVTLYVAKVEHCHIVDSVANDFVRLLKHYKKSCCDGQG